jgi:acyl carrier protein
VYYQPRGNARNSGFRFDAGRQSSDLGRRLASQSTPTDCLAQAVEGEQRTGGIRVATTYDRVRGIVAERLGVDEDKVTMEAEFIGDLNADSLDLVEVIMALEQEFGTEIKDEDAETIRSVGDAVRFIDEHL